MLSIEEVLERLAGSRSPDEVAETIRRLLPLPTIWTALREPGVVERCLAANDGALSPGVVLLAACGYSRFADIPVSPADERPTLSTDSLAADIQGEPSTRQVLLRCARLVAAASTPKEVAPLMLEQPEAWREALACAWPYLGPEPIWLQTLESLGDVGLRLAGLAVTSNSTAKDAAQALSAALGVRTGHAAEVFSALGEAGLAAALAAQPHELDAAAGSQDWLQASRLARLNEKAETALEMAQKAWDASQQDAAEAADALAEAADADGDGVTALEARRQAVRATPTPVRRAMLAVALAGQGDVDSARDILPSDSNDPLDLLARGIVQASRGDPEGASQDLSAGWSSANTQAALPAPLLRSLITAVDGAGNAALGLEISAAMVAAEPTNAALRRSHTERLLASGESVSAVDEARLALALEPASSEARRLLAQALQAAGRPADALGALGVQAGSDAKSMSAAAAYALEAGEADRAVAWSLRLLEEAPASTEAKSLHARALALGGAADEAIRELETLTEESPDDAQAWVTLAEVLARNGDERRAGEALTKGVQAVPDSPPLLMALGRWYAADSRWSEAEQLMRKACAVSEAAPAWLFEHAHVLDSLGRQGESLAAYERCVQKQPGNWPARIALAKAYESQDRWQEASRWLEGLPIDAPAAAHYAAGRLALRPEAKASSARQAAGHLLRARALGETEIELDWWLGRAYEAGDDPGRAAEAYGRVAQASQAGSDLHRRGWMSKGRIALSTGQPASAVASFEQLRQAHPQDSEVRLWLSKACSAAGLESESLAEARAAAELDPTSAEALAQWTDAARRSDSLQEAVEAASKLTELTPAAGPAWLALGDLLDRTGSPAQAREAVARAVAVGRKNAGLLRQGAELLARLDDAAAAERLLETAARLHPEDPQGWVSLAEFQERCGKPDAASESWLHAAKLQPSTEGASRRAAHALAKAGRPDEGYAVLQAAWESDPSDTTLRLDLAESLIERGQPEQALRLLQDVPEAKDLPPVQLGRAGVLLSRIGETESGLRLAREAADADAESAELWTGLAEVWLRANLPAESLPCLDRAVRLGGRSLTAYALLVHAHLSRGDAMSAWDALRAASSERPISLGEARSVAAAHLRLGEWQAALNTIEDYGQASHDASASIVAAEILLRMNDAWWLYGEIAGASRHAPAFSRDDLRIRTEEAMAALRLADGDPRRRLILARWQASIEPAEKSAAELEEAARGAGDPPAALEGLAIALLRNEAAQDAFRVVRRLAPSALDGAWQPLLAGLCHLRLGNKDWAVQAFQAASSDAALAPLARALESTVEAAPGDGARSIASLNDAVAAWPNEPAWHLQLANLYLEREELDSALPHLQSAADLDPENGDAWLALARALREAGHPDDAQQAYEQVVRLLPGLGLVWKEAGAIALGRGDFERAATWFARAQAASPSDVEALVGAARADLGLGRTRQARQKAETALEQSPESPLALESLAEVMAADGEVDKAISMLERASSQSDRPGAIRAGRARLLINHGRGDQAVVDLKNALEEDGDEALWAALADALASLGRFDEALEAGGEAVRISPRNASHRVRMGRISRQAGYLDRALDELTQAESLAQPTTDLSMEQGQVFEERREFDRALQAYQRAVELNPGLAQAYLRAGLVYRSLKAYPQAARMFKHAVELAPQDASALHQLAAVHALQLVHGGFHPSAVTT